MIRDQLMHYGWVQDARVSRRLPDTLVVDIVERKPTAIWQHHQRLALIDGEGVVLAPVKLDDMPDLPLVIGPDANRQTGQLSELIASTPSLKPMMAGATWIGGRRWDLRFQSGETLALPEGTEAAKAALQKFARLDTSARLLGFVRFDMRVPGKFVVRVSSEPGRRIDQDVADDAKSTTDT
jgi:cell division protein FtsQ